MRAFLEIFRLELCAVWRSGVFAALTALSVVWMIVFPYVVRGDGTAEGARELYVRFSLGGVFALLVVSLLASAAGSIAKERAARRLQLTMIRPVRFFAIVLGKIAAYVATGAVVLAVATACLAVRVDLSARCSHVLSPVLPSPREEARLMYAAYMNDPETPAAIRKTSKAAVLRLLEQRAIDHYQTIGTNQAASWRFDLGAHALPATGAAVRMRFTNQFEMRQDLVGLFRLGAWSGDVSNMTQAILTVPLARTNSAAGGGSETNELAFVNGGKNALMLRPRKDLNLLVPADSFFANLVRADLTLVAVLALVIAFGAFLSASLGRPVALFVAFVTLAVSEMSPSVIEQYPDSVGATVADRIGLAIARGAAEVTRPVSSLSPLEALSKDECIECRDVVRTVVTNAFVLPIVLSLLAAFALPRKQEGV